jgi:pimeloyl-[acyl-carrier protein] methyl ester esterase
VIPSFGCQVVRSYNVDVDSALPIVLLPGMDGTGVLFGEFAAQSPEGFRPIVVALPRSGSYDELTESAASAIASDGRFVIVAESFSGPIGIRLAVRFASRVAGLVLVNTLVVPPRPRALRVLPWSYIFAFPPLRCVVRALLVGQSASEQSVDRVHSVIARTDADTVSIRIRSVPAVNEIDNLARLQWPVLLLRGTRDRLVSKRSAEVIARHARRLTTCDVVGPHLRLQCQPAKAWRAIEDFVRQNFY